ncbi:hypothetical protein REPUB_Repub02eG0093600 [Reevesia pubescens]
MAEELEACWMNLTLTNEELHNVESDEVHGIGAQGDERKWMVGNILTILIFNKEDMIGTLKIVWKLAKDVDIMAL